MATSCRFRRMASRLAALVNHHFGGGGLTSPPIFCSAAADLALATRRFKFGKRRPRKGSFCTGQAKTCGGQAAPKTKGRVGA